MDARELLHDLTGAGFTIVVDDDKLVIRPASKLTDDIRAALRQTKPELLRLLSIQMALMSAINRACDARGDDEANRAALLADCAALTAEAQAEMLAHFTIVAAQYETINRGTPA